MSSCIIFLYLDKNKQIPVSNQINKYKMCIVSDQLATGGAERCAALLSVFFENNNCKVYHVVVVDKIEYEFSGEVLNLGKLKDDSNGFFNRIKRFRVLRNYFATNSFDYIIDFTPWVLYKTVYTDATGKYTISETTNPATEWYLQIDVHWQYFFYRYLAFYV